jgi:hypothetical protein
MSIGKSSLIAATTLAITAASSSALVTPKLDYPIEPEKYAPPQHKGNKIARDRAKAKAASRSRRAQRKAAR